MIRPPRSWFEQHGLDDFIPLIDDVLIRKNNAQIWAQQCRRLMRSFNPMLEVELQRDVMDTIDEYQRQHSSLIECLHWLIRDANAVLSRGNRAAAALKQLIESITVDDLPTPDQIIVEFNRTAARARRQPAPGRREPQMNTVRIEMSAPRIRQRNRPDPPDPQAVINHHIDPNAQYEPTAAEAAAAAAEAAALEKKKKSPPVDPVEARFSMLEVDWEEDQQ